MIKFVAGDLLNSGAEALVNTVNTVGVMGKGIARQFKTRFPNNYKLYRDACKAKSFATGQVLVLKDGDLMDQKLIINFPTKAHWKGASKYEYISTGLVALKDAIAEYKIKSIAIPPLGCGNGGFDWNKVKSMIEEALEDIDCDILVFTPNDAIKSQLQKEDSPKDVKLTNARAMLLYLMFQYEARGEQSSLFVANKLAYFLQRSGEKMKLKFEPHHYGPYAVQVNHVLLYLNGTYLKGMEQNEVKPFENLVLNYDKYEEVENYVEKVLSHDQKQRLNSVVKLVNGFESSFSLELLATVDYITVANKSRDTGEILKYIAEWSDRKAEIFERRYVEIAHEHLKNYSENTLELA